MARPKFAAKSTPSRGPIPKPTTASSMDPFDLWCQTASGSDLPVFVQCTGHTDGPTDGPTDQKTDRPTDRSLESLTTSGRCATRATRPNNNMAIYLPVCRVNDVQYCVYLESLGLSRPDYFNYLSLSGAYKVDGTDDKQEFQDTMVCLQYEHSDEAWSFVLLTYLFHCARICLTL